jgi:hypothetical protein
MFIVTGFLWCLFPMSQRILLALPGQTPPASFNSIHVGAAEYWKNSLPAFRRRQ